METEEIDIYTSLMIMSIPRKWKLFKWIENFSIQQFNLEISQIS